jgi:poly-gamma-glutamate synthesis protein (capsule biosynthesis protein)
MTLKLFACGDIVNSKSKKDFCDEKLQNIIKNSDISICNFEAPIKIKDMQAIPKAGPHVYQSKDSIKYLKNIGFNIVSMANDHIYDYTQSALESTVNELDKNSIDYIGAGVDFNSAYATKIIKKNGIKIGLLAGCENEFGCLYEKQNRGGYAWLFHHLIEDNIRELKQKVDSIVLIAHAGVEDIDFPIKEWRDRYKRLCDVGVDVIIGHHPHVPQGYEKYNNSMIFYSLGNFYFDTVGFDNKSDDSYSTILNFQKDGFKDFELIYHKKIDGKTCLVKANEVNFSIDKLNSYLNNDYLKRNNEVCLKLFYKYYYSYYESALGSLPSNASMLQKIKYFVKLLVGKQMKNDLLLLHNIKIDSHRFVVMRALEIRNNQ